MQTHLLGCSIDGSLQGSAKSDVCISFPFLSQSEAFVALQKPGAWGAVEME